MVYFEVNKLGFNCGYDRKNCGVYPSGCMSCLMKRLKELGFDSDSIRINEMDSEEKRLEMFRDQIWDKFTDVLNLRHIVLISKDGLPILDYPISGSQVDINTLSGFIQANITFSETERATNNGLQEKNLDEQFYEFQYKDFNILLKNGWFLRFCVILDHKPSYNLRNTLNFFQKEYEMTYSEKLFNLQKKGLLNFEDTKPFIIKTFEIELLFPMILTHSIPPNLSEQINRNIIQKSVVKFARELLTQKPFFFIHSLLDKVQNVLSNIEPSVILYEIYKLLELDIVIPSSLEEMEDQINSYNEIKEQKLKDARSISSLTKVDSDFYQQVGNMDNKSANQMIYSIIKKGKSLEKSSIFKEAKREYNKALFIAQKFGFTDDIGKISYLIVEVEDKEKQVELDYAMMVAESAEKKKDYITAIQQYKNAINITETHFSKGNDSKIKKLKKKVEKLQSNIM